MSRIQRIVADGKVSHSGDEARAIYDSLLSVPMWRHYIGDDINNDIIEEWAEKFLSVHSLMPGPNQTPMYNIVPMAIFEFKADGVFRKGAMYLNGAVIISEDGDVELLIEDQDAIRFRYPTEGYELSE